jgi:hypothetical protein
MLNSNKEVIKISKDTKEDIKSFIKIFMFLVVIPIAIGVIGGKIEANQSTKAYNNGICSECGGHYKFVSSSHIRNSSDEYYYSCEDCGYTIMTYIFYRGGN